MDGMLSQDEINALLAGMDPEGAAPAAGTEPDGEMDEALLTAEERDAIGEVANISMGTSATTLYSLVNRKVNITTPVVTLANWSTVIEDYEKPCVFIQIRYSNGLEGTNILVLKEQDVKVITDLMMGGDGTNTEGELGELHLSAISEAMNQMMGSSATSLSSMLGKTIDITPPDASLVDLTAKEAGEIADFLKSTFVKISFRMQIDDLVDSSIMQLYPVDFAKSLYDTFIDQQMPDRAEPAPQPVSVEQPAPSMTEPYPDHSGNPYPAMQNPYPPMQNPYPPMNNMPDPNGMGGYPGMNNMAGMGGMPNMGMGYGMNNVPPMNNIPPANPNVNVQQAQFQNFASDYNAFGSQENIDLIKDVPLEVTVELGRTKKSISDILDFAPGTIIELDKIAGEPIDVLVNGKFVARGEVVVIEESFGVRVTEIIK